MAEAGSAEVGVLIQQAGVVGTAIISRAEVAAALAKAVRLKLIIQAEGVAAFQLFSTEWESLVRLQMTEILVSRAASLAWDYSLRGYDAVHLASALFWRDVLGEPVTMASYDRQLWEAARATGLIAWPRSLP